MSREVSTTGCRAILLSNERIESTNRIINRIDELNQRIAFQNDPLIASWAAKIVPREPKTPSGRLKSPPRPSKEGPRAPKSGPGPTQDGPRPPQERSWNGLGAILGPSDHKIENKTDFSQTPFGFWVDFGSPNGSQNDPKTTPKRVKNQDEKCITFLSLLDPSWTGLEAILGPSWGQKSGFRIGFTMVS